jgi:nitrogen fixation NifU-like protein
VSQLGELYKKVVLEHNRNPRHYGTPAHYTHSAEGLNAICGDQVRVYLDISDDTIRSIHFDGESCAISTASASLMCEFLTGKSVAEAREHFARFCQLMDKNGSVDHIEELGQVNAIAGVKKFPTRIKSATLCWHAMNAALEGREFATTEK